MCGQPGSKDGTVPVLVVGWTMSLRSLRSGCGIGRAGGSTLVVQVAEVSGKVPDADDEAPSSAGVDVVLSKGRRIFNVLITA
jgi:hypothetical protein